VRSEGEALEDRLLRREDLVARRGAAPGAHGLDVALGGADVPRAPAPAVRVGGTADAAIVALGPVQGVVAALVARHGPVRHLVPPVAGGGEGGVDQRVAPGGDVVVGMAPRVARQGRTGLHREPVGAHVLGPGLEGEHGVEGGGGVGVGLPRRPHDEVHAHRREAGLARQRHRRRRLVGAVAPAQAGEHARDHGLHPEGHPRHPGGAPPGEEAGRGVLGIALGGDLGAGAARHGPEHPGEQLPGQARRGPAPHVHARRRGEALHLTGPVELGHTGRGVVVHERVAVGPGGEGAVVAARRAERHVDVDAEGGRGRHRWGRGRRLRPWGWRARCAAAGRGGPPRLRSRAR
jgi:hypothetical protein